MQRPKKRLLPGQDRLRTKVCLHTVHTLERESALTPRREDPNGGTPRHVPRPPVRGGAFQLSHARKGSNPWRS